MTTPFCLFAITPSSFKESGTGPQPFVGWARTKMVSEIQMIHPQMLRLKTLFVS